MTCYCCGKTAKRVLINYSRDLCPDCLQTYSKARREALMLARLEVSA